MSDSPVRSETGINVQVRAIPLCCGTPLLEWEWDAEDQRFDGICRSCGCAWPLERVRQVSWIPAPNQVQS
jgi:hypothetical protein